MRKESAIKMVVTAEKENVAASTCFSSKATVKGARFAFTNRKHVGYCRKVSARMICLSVRYFI